MNRGILFAALTAFVGSATATSCRRTADPKQLSAVDSLRTKIEAGALTLQELDVKHYGTADSILEAARPLFLDRFMDTLDRTTATLLGDQFVQLREAGRMESDHLVVRTQAEMMVGRLEALRTDLISGAIDDEAGATAIQRERTKANDLLPMVDQVIANYQAMQRVLERQALVDSILMSTLEHQYR